MSDAHTPGDWAVDPYLHRSGGAIWGADGMTVCHVTDRGGDTRANAEFIVRACNAHEEMVKALRAALPFASQYGNNGFTAAMIEAALAKAEGR